MTVLNCLGTYQYFMDGATLKCNVSLFPAVEGFDTFSNSCINNFPITIGAYDHDNIIYPDPQTALEEFYSGSASSILADVNTQFGNIYTPGMLVYVPSAYEPAITEGSTNQYYRGDKTFQTLNKTAVGLSNIDNTSDINKPISTATQTALNLKADTASLATVATTGSYTDLSNKPSTTYTPSALSLSLVGSGATGTQVSSTKNSFISSTCSTSVTVSLGGSPVSRVIMKICATNSSTEGDWLEVGRTSTSQPTTLTITVGGVYTQEGQITTILPAGWYVKLVNSGSGTHTEAVVSGTKNIYG